MVDDKLNELNEEMKKKEQEAKERLRKAGVLKIIRTEIKKFGKSSHIILSKEYLGKKAVVFVVDEAKLKENNKTPQNDKS